MIRACAVALLLAGTATAQDNCPSSDDLKTGIVRQVVGKNTMQHYQKRDDGLMIRQNLGDDGQPIGDPIVIYHPLTFDAWLARHTLWYPEYTADLVELDRLDEIGTWTTLALRPELNTTHTITATYLGQEMRDVGGCSYLTWIVEGKVRKDDTAPYWIKAFYAPDLRLVVEYRRIEGRPYQVLEAVVETFTKAKAPLPDWP